MLHTVLTLPSRNVGLQCYSLHFKQTATKTIMVHFIATCYVVICNFITSQYTQFSSIRMLVANLTPSFSMHSLILIYINNTGITQHIPAVKEVPVHGFVCFRCVHMTNNEGCVFAQKVLLSLCSPMGQRERQYGCQKTSSTRAKQ